MASFLVTGASRGFGLALVRELVSHQASKVGTVFAAARGSAPALDEIAQKSSGRVSVVKLGIGDQASIKKAAEQVETKLGGKGLDVLINNASICHYAFEGGQTRRKLHHVMAVHWVTSIFLPLLQKGTLKKFINVAASISQAPARTYLPAPAYKISKAAMNALTVQYAIEYEKEGFSFVALCPGWMKTELGGGDSADLAPEQSAKASLDIILHEGQKYNGKMPKLFVKGWENAEGPNKYDGGITPW